MSKLIHEIINLRNHIKRGEELAKQGYPTEMLNCVNREMLKDLQRDLIIRRTRRRRCRQNEN